jgi:GT2 family glycosyltransferase
MQKLGRDFVAGLLSRVMKGANEGLNRFCVADGISGTADRRAIPPNPSNGNELEQEPLNGERLATLGNEHIDKKGYLAGLETDLKEASARGARLEKLLAVTRSEAGGLEKALLAEQARVNYLLGRLQQLEAIANQTFVARIVQRPFKKLRDAGDRLTGGGLRALAKRIVAASVRYSAQNTLPAVVLGTLLKRVPSLASNVAAVDVQPSEAEAPERTPRPNPEERSRYSCWVAAYDTISSADRLLIRRHLSSLTERPLISVILSTAGKSTAALRETFNSVFLQLYENWELCVVVDVIAEPLIESLLRFAKPGDRRIKVVRKSSVDGVAAATNAALGLATGKFVSFLRGGDILPEHALYEVAYALGGEQRIDILYTDHDEIDPEGERSNPWFKPGWDPDLLLAQDYIGDLAVYRRTLVEAVGFLRPDCEGAEFYDLALRAMGGTEPDRVHHLPAILYHRHSETEANGLEKALLTLRAIRGAHRAVRDHLNAQGNPEARLGPASQSRSALRVTWPVPDPPPLVSVIIPTRDHAELLTQCVEGVLHRTDYPNIELLIVDNDSVEPATVKLLDRLSREEGRVRVLRSPGPFNYSVLNNAAARMAHGEVLLLLNNDIEVIEPGWLRELVSHALRPDVGIVGAKLIYADETIQHGGVTIGPGGQITHLHRFASRNDPGYCGQLSVARTLMAVTGACVAIRRVVFFEVGGFEEINLQVSCNDIDLCLRLRKFGYRVVWTPFAELFHLESVSRGYDDFTKLFRVESVFQEAKDADPIKREQGLREWCYMQKTWSAPLESGDPFHNPNLLFDWDHLEIPSTPRREKPWRLVGQPASSAGPSPPFENEIEPRSDISSA